MKRKYLSGIGIAAAVLLLAGSLIILTGCPSDPKPGPTQYKVDKTPVNPDSDGSFDVSPAKAAAGKTITLTAHPATDRKLDSFTVTKAAGGTVSVTKDPTNENKATFIMPASNVVVSANFIDKNAPTFDITIASGIQNGSVETDPANEAQQGATVTLTADPADGYALTAFTVKRDDTQAVVTVTKDTNDNNKGTFEMPAADVTVSATFYDTTAAPFSITIASGIENGSVETDPANEAQQGATVTLTADPADGYALTAFTVTNDDTGVAVTVTMDATDPNKGTFEMPGADVTVSATFTPISGPTPFNITIDPDIENGTVTSDPDGGATQSYTVTLTAEPDTDYALSAFTVTNDDTGETVVVTMNATDPNKGTFRMPGADVTVTAAFYDINGPDYSIQVTPSVNGEVTPNETTSKAGQFIYLTIEPDPDYELDTISVTKDTDGEEVALINWQTGQYFVMPADDVTVTATFKEKTKYFISIDLGIEDGEITADLDEATEGTRVTLTAEPDDDFHLKEILVIGDESSEEIPTHHDTVSDTWYFDMPAESVTVTAEFESDSVAQFAITYTPYTKGRIDGIEEASDGTLVHISVEPIAGYRLVTGSLKVTGENGGINATYTSGTTWTFPMPDEEVTITAEFESIDQVYSIYSDGVLNAGTAMFNGATGTVPTPDGTGEGRGYNATALKLNPPANNWYGFTLDRRAVGTDPHIDLSTVDALSFWIRVEGADLTIQNMGFGNATTIHQVGLSNVVITSEWQRVIIPVPERKSGNLGTGNTYNYFYYSCANSVGRTIYIDDMEYITADRTVKTVSIPASTPVIGAPPITTAAASLVGRPTITYTVEAQGLPPGEVALASRNDGYNEINDLAQWHTYEYAVTGNVSEANGILTPTAPSSTFTLALKINGVTSNVLNGTIAAEMFSSEVIDMFDYGINEGGNGNTGNTSLGITIAGGGWNGIYADGKDGRPNIIQAGAVGGTNISIARVMPSASVNDITQFKDSHPVISLWLYEEYQDASPETTVFTFELSTEAGAWIAPTFTVNNLTGGAGNSGWNNILIPLSGFMKGGDSLADEASIVITGWKISAVAAGVGTPYMFITEIKLVGETPIIDEDLSSLEDAAYAVDDGSVDPLIVAVLATGNEGAYTYQWFSCTNAAGANPEPVGGATNATFTPPVDAEGIFYYYAEVTYPETGNSSRSRVIKITVGNAIEPLIITDFSAGGAVVWSADCSEGVVKAGDGISPTGPGNKNAINVAIAKGSATDDPPYFEFSYSNGINATLDSQASITIHIEATTAEAWYRFIIDVGDVDSPIKYGCNFDLGTTGVFSAWQDIVLPLNEFKLLDGTDYDTSNTVFSGTGTIKAIGLAWDLVLFDGPGNGGLRVSSVTAE